ncbi:MAG TPA: MFS transporter, partial [Solirubrobacteraceae bacterium]|nr:MFS transporter [Solirubrobacteraceae bacterium]
NTSTWLGGALGIAIASAISTSRADHLLAVHATVHHALTSGFQRALLACSIAMLAAAVLAVRATNTRGEPAATSALDVVPLPENA